MSMFMAPVEISSVLLAIRSEPSWALIRDIATLSPLCIGITGLGPSAI